jgi:hypothetical protein
MVKGASLNSQKDNRTRVLRIPVMQEISLKKRAGAGISEKIFNPGSRE